MKKNELKALISLLDDTDHEVINHVESKIVSLGDQIIPMLEKEWENNLNPMVQERIEELIHTVQFDLLKERLKSWKATENKSLLEGMWLISTYLYPDVELQELEQYIEEMYQKAVAEVNLDDEPDQQLKKLNNIFFTEYRFSANTKNFHSPSNSMLNTVLQSKKGNPMSLCVAYMLLGRKIGLPLYGVNLPNLFVLTYKTEKEQFYINVFNRGLIFSTKDIKNYIAQINVEPRKIFFEPCSYEDILIRTCRNLKVSFEKLGEPDKVSEIEELMAIFQG